MLSAAEFMIAYPGGFIQHTGDILIPGALQIGNSVDGISLSFPIPVNANHAGLLMSASFLWWCNNCMITNVAVDVLPHPANGGPWVVTWPDLVLMPAIGMRSLVCSTVPVEETSWGQIKSLYQE
jgi:hypothetical protein